MTRAIAVFAKQPVPGRVKTRLARHVGDEQACRIYTGILRMTLGQVARVEAERYLFLPPGDSVDIPPGFVPERQRGDDLGRRMSSAFDLLFRRGHEEVVLVGSDCPYLDAGILELAFEKLEQSRCVLGPSPDGGYYLVGQQEPGFDLFSDIPWSTPGVWAATMRRAEQLGLVPALLEPLEDVDDLDSYNRWLQARKRQ